MDPLETALDDLDGLLEAYRALADDSRSSELRRSPDGLKQLQRETAAAADAYAATLIATGNGDVTAQRIDKCRQQAQAEMKDAVAKQKELAALVNQRRLPSAAVREDVKQLVTLSLHCRAAVAALAPTVDKRAAEALANKVLVELREATLGPSNIQIGRFARVSVRRSFEVSFPRCSNSISSVARSRSARATCAGCTRERRRQAVPLWVPATWRRG